MTRDESAAATEHDALDVSQGEAGMTPDVTAFFHDWTYTITYVVSEPEGEHCAIVDSVLDYDPVSGRTTTVAADILIGFLRERSHTLDWILETHAHADLSFLFISSGPPMGSLTLLSASFLLR
ncbi:MAG: hypothetical protein IIA72_13595 [Proteobacteria bacterium]|nr:hypothetical protein [Pseudomonadota bacterium]